MYPWLVLVFVLWSGCVPSQDDWPAGRPEIIDVNFVDVPNGSSQKLAFRLEFMDSDQDLGTGSLMVTVNGEIDSEIRMPELFDAQIPKLDAAASEGELRFEVSLSGISLTDGEFVDFEFALCDASGQTSNIASLRLLTVLTE